MKLNRIVLGCLALLLAVAASPAAAQAEGRSIGVDLQRYPVGSIAWLTYRHPLSSKSVWSLGVGYNDADREDNGEFSDEQAQGPGVSVGYRIYRNQSRVGWSLGGRVDLWDLEVDWIDQRGTPAENRGTTDTLVLQPTVVAAHEWALGNWQAELSLAVGAEINVKTDGPDVGEGAIVLGGIALHRRF